MKNGKKRRRQKSKLDDSEVCRPRRFLTAYNLFFKHERAAQLRSQSCAASTTESLSLPASSDESKQPPKGGRCSKKKWSGKPNIANISKDISARWKSLSPEERKVYEDMANKDLIRYQREMDSYQLKLAEEQKRVKKKSDEDSSSEESLIPAKPQHIAEPDEEEEEPEKEEAKCEPESSFSTSNSSKITNVEVSSAGSTPYNANNQTLCSVNPTKIMPYLAESFNADPNEGQSSFEVVSKPQEASGAAPAEKDSVDNALQMSEQLCFDEYDASLLEDLSGILADQDNLCNVKRERSIDPFVSQTNKLYGRNAHLATIIDTYAKVSQSQSGSKMVLVSGYSGAGKSALVQQAQKPITDMGGNFVSSKFDHFRQMEPLSAIILAFTELCNEIATRDAEKLHQTRSAIQEKVGSEVAFLANIIPCLSQIIQILTPETVHIDGKESQNRIKYVFQLFVRAIATPSQPLVLFLDDLQWADSLSLDLIESLVIDSENEHFLFIGAYRDNEVTETHPLSAKLRNIASKQVCITKVKVGDISKVETNEMISDMIQSPPHLTQPLTDTVYRKTRGNVLCVLQFLGSLCDEGLLSFSSDSKQWQWDIATIDSKNIVDNTADLMLSKILQLPKQTQTALKFMACLGYYCEELILTSIAAADDITHFGCDDLFASLELATKEGLVDHVGTTYKFVHDQIQLATYTLIPENERCSLHLWIGCQVWANKSASPDKALFIVVGQLNKGAALMKDPQQKIQLAGLNLEAAQKSKSLAAFAPAAFYLNTAIGLLEKNSWVEHYDLCLQLYSSCAEAEYCIGHFVEMNKKLEEVFSKARCLDDKLGAFFTLISSLMAQGRGHQALEAGLLVCSQLGESFPTYSDLKAIIVVEFTKVKQMIEGRTDDELLTMKEMDDRHKIAAMKLMYVLAHTSFLASCEIYALIILRMMQTSLSHGICDESAFGFASFGSLMSGVFRDINGAYRFGQLSLRLLDRTKAKKCLPGVYAVVYVFIHPLVNHFHESLGPLEDAYNVGMRCGDVSFAMSAAGQFCMHSFHCGKELTRFEAVVRKCCNNMMEHKQEQFCKFLLPYWQAVLNLMGRSDDPQQLNGEVMNQEELLKESLETKRIRAVAVIYHIRSWLAYFFGNYVEASKMMEKRQAIPLMSSPPFLSCSLLFVEGLISFAMANLTREAKWNDIAKNSIKEMKRCTLQAPLNCQHKLLILQAESASLLGEYDTAARRYDDAIHIARQNGFVQDQALAYERTGIFYSNRRDTPKAYHYYGQAYNTYIEWGAKRKADDLRLKCQF